MFEFIRKHRKTRSSPDRAAGQRARLGCEPLEVRALLASYTWAPTDGYNWSTAANWLRSINGGAPERTSVLPGENDNVSFVAEAYPALVVGGVQIYPPVSGDFDCVVDVNPTVHSVLLGSAYNRTVKLQGSLTITGSDTSSLLTLNGNGGAALGGYINPTTGAITRGTVNLAGKAQFGWMQGTLRDLTVNVLWANATTYARFNVSGNSTNTTQMRNVTLAVGGVLDWSGRNVTVIAGAAGQERSRISIVSTGQFNITGDAATWGVGGNPADLLVDNHGTVTHDSANTHTLVGDYQTEMLTQIKQGKLVIGGTAEQTTNQGLFDLYPGSTVEVTGPDQTLKIKDGRIRGTGTVAGRLQLGATDNPTTALPEITPGFEPNMQPGAPGYAPGLGTITVTQWFQMIGAATARIQVAGGGFDKIEVGSYASLGGALIVWADPNYQPPTGTTLSFLVTQGGITGDFVTKTVPQNFWASATPGRTNHWGTQKNPDWYDLVVMLSPGGQQPP